MANLIEIRNLPAFDNKLIEYLKNCYIKAKENALLEINIKSYNKRMELLLVNKDNHVNKLSILSSGVEPVNFVYGEIEFIDFLLLLFNVVNKMSLNNIFNEREKGLSFVDLGCGSG